MRRGQNGMALLSILATTRATASAFATPLIAHSAGVRSRLADARRRKRVLGFHRRLRFALGHFSPSKEAAAAPSPDRKGRSPAPQWLAATPLRPANLRALGKIENVTRGGIGDASKSERRLERGRSDSLADKADRFGEHSAMCD